MKKLKIKGVVVKQSYYKRSRPNRPLMWYEAWGRGDGSQVDKVHIHIDPILKKYPDHLKDSFKHEKTEIVLRHRGVSESKAHKVALSKEGNISKGKSLRQLWKELKK